MGAQAYQVILSLHLISVISWMAGLLYLIRLFVYHAAETEPVVQSRFKIMESKLYRVITVPAMAASLLFGLLMLAMRPVLFAQPWMQVKLLTVTAMLGVTMYCGKVVSGFREDRVLHSERFFRFFNEVPTLLMVLIVFMVILKPLLW